jgi:uncharacterized protein YlxW (UPF0749 family)
MSRFQSQEDSERQRAYVVELRAETKFWREKVQTLRAELAEAKQHIADLSRWQAEGGR